jgi:hypothetical protein
MHVYMLLKLNKSIKLHVVSCNIVCVCVCVCSLVTHSVAYQKLLHLTSGFSIVMCMLFVSSFYNVVTFILREEQN